MRLSPRTAALPPCGALAAGVLICAAGAAGARAAEHAVRPDGTGDYPTIQAAIDAAAPGDTIVLEDGLFTGAGNRDIDFAGKDLTVRSRNGAGACTIDSQGSPGEPHRAFHLHSGESAAARIEGITITGGYVEGPFPESGGGGILVEYGTHPVISQCVFDGNEAGFHGFGGGLLAWEDCDITLQDCVFVNGLAGWYGGGFVLRKYCDATVERCLVDGNYAGHAGGGASMTRSDATVTDCQFSNNTVTEAGGGGVLVKAEGAPIFTRCVFAGNTSWAEAALGIGTGARVTVIECLFEANSALTSGSGGVGLDSNASGVTLQNCTFVNNATPGFGAHMNVDPTSTATVRTSIFWGSCAGASTLDVGAGGTLDVDCCIVEGGAGGISGAGTLLYGASNIALDPLFCDPAACGASPLPAGLYSIRTDSPASAESNPCGLLGAYPPGCSTTGAREGLRALSWGSLKALYRAR